MKKYLFPLLVAMSALLLAGVAGFFSITGLSKLFSGAQTEVIIMASALELAKLVTASFLHRYWKSLKWMMKMYLLAGVMVVMIITSLGIYGFLVNAYQITSNNLEMHEGELGMIDGKIAIFQKVISDNEKITDKKNKRIDQLSNLRSNQENRIDSAKTNKGKDKVRSDIEKADVEIQKLTHDIDELNAKNAILSDSVSKYNTKNLELKNGSSVAREVGPLKYIAKLTGKDMDSVVNFFIMLLIFVFDPLAVSLVIATNIAFEREFGDKKEEKHELENTEIIEDEKRKYVEEKNNEQTGKSMEEPMEEPIKEKLEEPTGENIEQDNKIIPLEVEKPSEAIQYIADEKGEFKPIEAEEIKNEDIKEGQKIILDQIKSQGIKHNSSYLTFLDVLFKSGELKSGDPLIKYDEFLEEIKSAGISFKEKEVKDFLIICNLFKITDMSDPDKKQVYKIAKEYGVAKEIISLLSK